MKWLAGLRNHLRAISSTVFPSLRVIGMAYTGLIGIGAAALVVSVAFLPVAPVLQQATQPAREAVAVFVQPATDVVTNLIIAGATAPRGPLLLFVQPPLPAVASAPIVEDEVPDDAVPSNAEASQPVAARVAVARPPQLSVVPVAKANVSRGTDAETSDPDAEDVPVDEPQQAVETRDRAPVREVAVAPAAPVQQEASVEAPRPLPTQPAPTEAAWQIKARLDVENQAAIDATKASIVRRKAAADTANQAAIDVQKSTSVYVAAPSPTETAETAQPLPAIAQATAPTLTPQTLIAANADNQTLIDAARAARLRATADANAANQAAIDAARAPRSPARATPVPTLQPAPAKAVATQTPAPSPTPEPAPPAPVVKAADPVRVDVLDDQPIDLDEMPITLAVDKASDVSR